MRFHLPKIFVFSFFIPTSLIFTINANELDNNGPIDQNPGFVQERSKNRPKSFYRTLGLKAALEQGLRANLNQKARNFEESIADLDWKDQFWPFWFPTIQLALTTNSQRMARPKKGKAPTTESSKTPSGQLALQVSEYTVFNWGKDYLAYLNLKESYQRKKQAFEEEKRNLKLEITALFFKLSYLKQITDFRKDWLKRASFVYKLNKEKVALQKTDRRSFYLSRDEYLQAQHQYFTAKNALYQAFEEMALMLNDTEGTRYVVSEKIQYKKLRLPIQEAYTISANQSPRIKEATKDFQNSLRSYEIAKKEILPLPKFSINLGAYTHAFGPSSASTNYETDNGGSHLEVVASINATWTLLGDGGLLNSRKLHKSTIQKELSHHRLKMAKRSNKGVIRDAYNKILQYQNMITILKAKKVNAQRSFDTIFDQYTKTKSHSCIIPRPLEIWPNPKKLIKLPSITICLKKLAWPKKSGSVISLGKVLNN